MGRNETRSRRQRKRRLREWTGGKPPGVDDEPKEPVEAPVSAVRAYAEQILDEPPPVLPSAPYEGPEPPAWMIAPTLVHNVAGQPSRWLDEAPLRAWEGRQGQAAYELLREDRRDVLRYAGTGVDPGPSWAPKEHPLAKTNGFINHLANRLTVFERERRGLRRPWNKPEPPKQRKELPEAECGWAPWSYS
ncbi:hypothetical protein GCM10010302_26510 [Streptomyces polychromogenes]|uniref:Uncharacterized protein n=1 Tax=Streptomyces polychromogenes TaxID=67342 RepID=A0ABP3EZG6_9ACTN